MTGAVDLDDATAVAAADEGGLLRAVASAAAQVRESVVLSAEAGVTGLRDEGRPRAVVVCATGLSAGAGEVLAALSGASSPVPVLLSREPVLGPWVGAADVVVGVSASGEAPETLAAVEQAVRRGARLLAVGAPGSPLEELTRRGRGVFVPAPAGRPARAALWSLVVPLLVAGDALGMLTAGQEELEETAAVLEDLALRCRPDADALANPGKALAQDLADALPVVWGTSPLAGAAATRLARRLVLDAGVPALAGELPDAAAVQLAALDGPFAGGASSDDDLFRDRVDEPDGPVLRLVVLRDPQELPAVGRQAEACAALAGDRGVGVSALRAEGRSAPARLASLVAMADFASTYLALSRGADPSAPGAVQALHARTPR